MGGQAAAKTGLSPAAGASSRSTSYLPARSVAQLYTTPHSEVDLTCCLVLRQFLAARFPSLAERVAKLLLASGDESIGATSLQEWCALRNTLRDISVVDPACGEGHFLTGMRDVLTRLDTRVADQLGCGEDSEVVRATILRQLHGVEVQPSSLAMSARALLRGGTSTDSDTPALNLACGDSLTEDQGFSWSSRWPDIVAQGGFDIVVGNPPYLRHERIDDPRGRLSRPEYKRQAIHAIYRRLPAYFRWDEARRESHYPLDGRSDLATLFTFLALSLLRPGGVLGFVLPVAMFQAQYGKRLTEFIQATGRDALVIESRNHRSFHASVNTVLLLAWEAEVSAPRSLHLQRVTVDRSFSEVDLLGLAARQTTDVRRHRFDRESVPVQLLRDLHAPTTALRNLGHMRYSVKTGINQFFYLDGGTVAHFGIEPEYCHPVLRSPREIHSICVERREVRTVLFLCPHGRAELADLGKWGALRYIEWGSQQVTTGGVPWPSVSSVQGRPHWYTLNPPPSASIVCPRFFDRRFFFLRPEAGLLDDQTFYGLVLGEAHSRLGEPLAAILNCSLTYLLVETHGRTGLGDGVRQYALGDMAALPVIDPRALEESEVSELVRRFRVVASRPILPVDEEMHQLDRRALDSVVAHALDMTESEMATVRRTLVRLTNQRLARALNVAS